MCHSPESGSDASLPTPDPARPPRGTAASSHSRRIPALALCLLVLVVQAGCALRGEGVRTDPEADGLPEPTFLEVENQNFRDARIYVIWEGVRTRVGMVVGNTTETFRFEKQQGQLLRVEVDFVAGGGFVTEEMQVWPGETASLVISPASGL
jgi:hypothetical protein